MIGAVLGAALLGSAVPAWTSERRDYACPDSSSSYEVSSHQYFWHRNGRDIISVFRLEKVLCGRDTVYVVYSAMKLGSMTPTSWDYKTLEEIPDLAEPISLPNRR